MKLLLFVYLSLNTITCAQLNEHKVKEFFKQPLLFHKDNGTVFDASQYFYIVFSNFLRNEENFAFFKKHTKNGWNIYISDQYLKKPIKLKTEITVFELLEAITTQSDVNVIVNETGIHVISRNIEVNQTKYYKLQENVFWNWDNKRKVNDIKKDG